MHSGAINEEELSDQPEDDDERDSDDDEPKADAEVSDLDDPLDIGSKRVKKSIDLL